MQEAPSGSWNTHAAAELKNLRLCSLYVIQGNLRGIRSRSLCGIPRSLVGEVLGRLPVEDSGKEHSGQREHQQRAVDLCNNFIHVSIS
jgi:hypothetical protein